MVFFMIGIDIGGPYAIHFSYSHQCKQVELKSKSMSILYGNFD